MNYNLFMKIVKTVTGFDALFPFVILSDSEISSSTGNYVAGSSLSFRTNFNLVNKTIKKGPEHRGLPILILVSGFLSLKTKLRLITS
ncbi:hypothetical protein SAMN04487890_12463 [Mucilaginibacter polytrichastri]|nr:hypothetical protein SAMN04487890_12463 [Mucilaginibacter polytrichastri]